MTDSWRYGGVAEQEEPVRFPWPPEADESVIGAFGATWRGLMADPARTFSLLQRRGGVGAALLYFLVIGILVAGAGLFWEMTSILSYPAGIDEELSAALETTAMGPVVRFLLAPMLLMITILVSAGVTHLLLLILDGANHGFQTTLRVFAYSYSPQIFAVVPILGALVGTVWMLVLAVIGLREAHETEGWKAGVAVVAPFAIMLLLTVLLFMVLAAGAAILTG